MYSLIKRDSRSKFQNIHETYCMTDKEGLQVLLTVGYKRPNRHILLNILVIYIQVTKKTYSHRSQKLLKYVSMCKYEYIKQNERRIKSNSEKKFKIKFKT